MLPMWYQSVETGGDTSLWHRAAGSQYGLLLGSVVERGPLTIKPVPASILH